MVNEPVKEYKQCCTSRKHPPTYMTVYTDACKTHYTIPVCITVFLKI